MGNKHGVLTTGEEDLGTWAVSAKGQDVGARPEMASECREPYVHRVMSAVSVTVSHLLPQWRPLTQVL